MPNKRVFYACQAVVITAPSDPDNPGLQVAFDGAVKGVQSVGITTNFNLEQVFELGQIQIFENIEGVPDVEVTLEKIFAGETTGLTGSAVTLFEMCTAGAAGLSLVNRSKQRCRVSLGVYDDADDAVAGNAPTEIVMDGLYVSSLSYNIPVDGQVTESITLVGNSKVFSNAATNVTGNKLNVDPFGDDGPTTPSANAGGVQRRENVQIESCAFPSTVAGTVGTGQGNGWDSVNLIPRVHLQNITISTDFSREDILELGRKAPYYRAPNFPIEVTCDIETIATSTDGVIAFEEGKDSSGGANDNSTTFNNLYGAGVAGTINDGDNSPEEEIYIFLDDQTSFDLKDKNRLSSVTYGGGDASGGNTTITYSYTNFNELEVDGGVGI